ncbi:MAG TPA: glycosyltransferase family 2 protein [bacterium]|nr:glycosyltransferase family 2 protein [bacterium]
MDPWLSLIIPAFNEANRIGTTLERISAFLRQVAYDFEVVVVSDGSTDATGEMVTAFAAHRSDTRLINLPHNQGKGAAVRAGVLESKGKYVCFTDADLSAPIEDIAVLFTALQDGYDVAIGSRALSDSAIGIHQPLYREMLGKTINWIIRRLYLPDIHDTQCGFKLFTAEAAQRLFEPLQIQGMLFDVEILYRARLLGMRVAEVPVRWDNAPGSKFAPTIKNAWQVVRDLISLRNVRVS